MSNQGLAFFEKLAEGSSPVHGKGVSQWPLEIKANASKDFLIFSESLL